MTLKSLGTALLLSTTVFGCDAPVQPDGLAEFMGYEDFVALTYQEPETGIYVLNGDEIAETEADLEAAYNRYVDSALGIDTTLQPLAINLKAGDVEDKWSPDAALNLTYCIDTRSFGANANALVAALDTAAADWAGVARVNFVYASNQNRSCNNRNNAVVFNVRQVRTSQYLARAFFPSNSRSARELLVSNTSFRNIAPWTLRGVLTHELGHAIGFRHEHTRPEAVTCFEHNNWRGLTAYDSNSVMHYPQCNGTNNGDLSLTDLDRAGAAAAYP